MWPALFTQEWLESPHEVALTAATTINMWPMREDI